MSNYFLVALVLVAVLFLFGVQNVYAETYITDNITDAVVWREVDGPFIIPGPIAVESGASLTIEPGTVVQFGYQSGLDVYGAIRAQGAADEPIYFISEFDTSFIERAPDEDPYIPPAGMWTDIYVAGPITTESIFEHVVVRSSSGGVYVDERGVNFDSILFEYNDAGLSFRDSRSKVTKSVFKNTDEAFVVFNGSSVEVQESVISNVPHEDAIVIFEGGEFVGSNVRIDGVEGASASGVVVFNNSSVNLSDSVVADSAGDGIVMFNGSSLELEDVRVENIDGTALNDLGSRVGFSQNQIVLDRATLSKSGYGFSVSSSHLALSATSIIDNSYGAFNYSTTSLDLSRVWWGDQLGPYQANDNPDGLGNEASDGLIVRPWLTAPPGEVVPNTKPTVSGLGQYMMDSATAIGSGGVTSQGVVIKGFVRDEQSVNLQLEVEVKTVTESFTGTNLVRSAAVGSNTLTSITVDSLGPGVYHWRARAVAVDGRVSDWVEFGSEGVDFSVRGVPLYTQVVSEYPSRSQTDSWASEIYAFGNSDCGVSISACGCAMTSAVMIMRYHNITTAAGQDVNPLTLNAWLLVNKGFIDGGGVNWLSVAKYAGYKIAYDAVRSGNYKDNYAILDEYLAKGWPVIARATNRGGLNLTHFFVIESKQGDTYTVKDPSWYNTKTLNESVTSKTGKVRAYENGFDGLRLFYPSDGVAQVGTVISLASPAELLITDQAGRRLGADPRTNTRYQEIPNASYIYESIDDASEALTSDHEYRMAYLGGDVLGTYQVQVIGTGNGSFTLEAYAVDSDGEVHTDKHIATTTPGLVTSYVYNYDPEVPSDISLDIKKDAGPPEGLISFDPVCEKLVVTGIGEHSTTTVRTRGPVYIIKDAFANRTRLVFGLFGRFGQDRLETSLKFIRYGRNKMTSISENHFEYRWKKDNRGQLVELHQTITLVKQGTITATYSSHSGQTRVIIQQGKGKKEIKIVPGLYLLSMATSQGKLHVQQ